MKICFNDNWSFQKTTADASKEADWSGCYTPVSLPHDFLISDPNDLYATAFGRYIKSYDFGEIGKKRFRLYFEGVYMDSTIYINHTPVFDWKYGYSSFEVDITDHLVDGINEIEVLIRHYSPNTRWYSGAGIYRDVYLIETPLSCVISDSIYFHCEQDEGGVWNCHLSGEFQATKPGQTAVFSLRSPQRTLYEVQLPAKNIVMTDFSLNDITDSEIWDIEHPNCLTVTLALYDTDKCLLDETSKSTGLRSIQYTPEQGFFLNHRHIKLHGVCLHHDLGCLGAAFHKAAARRQLLKMKEMGVNAIRTSHNMPAPDFMELCDELGLLVDSEAFDMWERPKTEYDYARFFKDWYEKDVASWVRRDRNHPSIIMWSVGNEIYDTHISSRGVEIARLLHEAVRKHDPLKNAPTTIGSNYMQWEGAQNCAREVDLVGYNYGEHLYEEHHKRNPHWCIYGSETTAGVKSRGIYHFPRASAFLTHDDLQCSSLGNCRSGISAKTAQDIIALDRDHALCAGMFLWTGADYIGEPTPYNTKNAYYGSIDTAGLEKDSFYLYQAAWTDQPVLHLLPYWDFNNGQLIDVIAYTNLSTVTFFLNDRLISTCEVTEYTAHLQIPYEPGQITVTGCTKDGQLLTDSRHSFGNSASIVLSADRMEINADGEDMVMVTVSTMDADGYTVDNARDRIFLQVRGGRLLGFDNGDSTDYESYQSCTRRLFSGKAVAYIAAPITPMPIIVTATGNGLKHSTLVISTTKKAAREGISLCDIISEQLPEINEIPLRKIELSRSGDSFLTPEAPVRELTAVLHPQDTTYRELAWSVVTDSGIATNLAALSVDAGDPTKATLRAVGDGSFRLRCLSKNGHAQPEIISEYEFTAEGFGKASFDPYEFIAGCLYNDSQYMMDEVRNGGVNIKADNRIVGFTKTDFGKAGSDHFLVRMINWFSNAPFDFTLWLGYPNRETSQCLGTYTYQADFEWQTYKDNSYVLPKKICKEQDLYFEFQKTDLRIDFGGFLFEPIIHAYEVIPAPDTDVIHGDSYQIQKDRISHIGNNVFLIFQDMNFTRGTSGIRITGKTYHDNDSIHVYFTVGNEQVAQEIIEFPFSEQPITVEQPLPDIAGDGYIEFCFLPGCDFDFISFEILPATE